MRGSGIPGLPGSGRRIHQHRCNRRSARRPSVSAAPETGTCSARSIPSRPVCANDSRNARSRLLVHVQIMGQRTSVRREGVPDDSPRCPARLQRSSRGRHPQPRPSRDLEKRYHVAGGASPPRAVRLAHRSEPGRLRLSVAGASIATGYRPDTCSSSSVMSSPSRRSASPEPEQLSSPGRELARLFPPRKYGQPSSGAMGAVHRATLEPLPSIRWSAGVGERRGSAARGGVGWEPLIEGSSKGRLESAAMILTPLPPSGCRRREPTGQSP